MTSGAGPGREAASRGDPSSLPAQPPGETSPQEDGRLRRELGLLGAGMMGLGSIIGTGVFVSIALAAGAAGPAVVLAIPVAALVAGLNGLSSAQLAASYPVSGGTYEYGYRLLTPSLGFAAGWMFLCAKTASAATAALGFAGYVLTALGADGSWRVPLAVAAVAALTLLVRGGARRSSRANAVIVSATLASLAFFIVLGLPRAMEGAERNLRPFFAPLSPGVSPAAGFLEACALMFVAFTGYGRIATLGEEVRRPRSTIPLAIIGTLLVTLVLYTAVGLAGVASVGVRRFAEAGEEAAAPLGVVARELAGPGAGLVLAAGAVTAMLGVLLNLILGLSRVVLAMGRRGDLPAALGRLDPSGTTPGPAVVSVGVAIGLLVLIGDVKTTWSFSAFTVLLYYALTNLAALRLGREQRLYPRPLAWAGLLSCVFLSSRVESGAWMAGLALVGAGLLWRGVRLRMRGRERSSGERL